MLIGSGKVVFLHSWTLIIILESLMLIFCNPFYGFFTAKVLKSELASKRAITTKRMT